MEIVNGIPCLNCSDVERAKKTPAGGTGTPDRTAFPAGFAAPRTFDAIAFPSPDGFRGRTFDRGV
ncbi:MAG: hypothetical protein ACKOEE_09185 [Tagaea sp.]